MWKKLLTLLLTLAIVRGEPGRKPRCKDQAQVAKNIVDYAKRAKLQIDSFKDGFVAQIFWSEMDWDKACIEFPPGSVVDPCLPSPPPPSEINVSENFEYELVQMYSLLQGYNAAFSHLTLDRVLHNSQETLHYTREIQQAAGSIEGLLNVIFKNIVVCQGMTPDNAETESHLGKIYTDVGPDRVKRDFAILRDTLDALQYCIDIFTHFKM